MRSYAPSVSPAKAHQLISGPAVYRRVSRTQRPDFDVDFRRGLHATTSTFDLDPLKAVLRKWWLATSGDAHTAHLALEYARTLATRRRPTVGDLEPACERNGPAILTVLDAVQQDEFVNAWHRLCVDVLDDYDLAPFEAHLTYWWNLTASLDAAFVATEVAATVGGLVSAPRGQ